MSYTGVLQTGKELFESQLHITNGCPVEWFSLPSVGCILGQVVQGMWLEDEAWISADYGQDVSHDITWGLRHREQHARARALGGERQGMWVAKQNQGERIKKSDQGQIIRGSEGYKKSPVFESELSIV